MPGINERTEGKSMGECDDHNRVDELQTKVAVMGAKIAARETLNDTLFVAIGIRLDELRDGQKAQNRLAVTLMSGLILALVAGVIALA